MDTKIIIIGTPTISRLLQTYDEDFRRHFKLDFVRSSGVGEGIDKPGVQFGSGFSPVVVRRRR